MDEDPMEDVEDPLPAPPGLPQAPSPPGSPPLSPRDPLPNPPELPQAPPPPGSPARRILNFYDADDIEFQEAEMQFDEMNHEGAFDPDAARCVCSECIITETNGKLAFVTATDPPMCCGRGSGQLGCITHDTTFLAQLTLDDQGRPDQVLFAGDPARQRYKAYRKAFDLLHDEPDRSADRERVPLPLCVVTIIRQAWPDPAGLYTGYQEADNNLSIPRQPGYGVNHQPE